MIMSAIAKETFMNYEILYQDDNELSLILGKLNHMKYADTCKEVHVIPGNYRDKFKGAVFTCIRCDAADALYHALNNVAEVSREVHTIYDDYISIDN